MKPGPQFEKRQRPQHKATIIDVAKSARVSTSAVSRALAGREGVSEQVRERIRHVAESLGYQPSRVARSLRAGRSLTVGVVIPDIQNPFFTSVVRGIEDAMQAAGYTLLLGNSDEEPDRERACLQTLRLEGAAGIIFVPINARAANYQHLVTPPVALVSFDDMPWAASLNPPLTAVAQPVRKIGAAPAQLLLSRIQEPEHPIWHVVLETKPVLRASCGHAGPHHAHSLLLH